MQKTGRLQQVHCNEKRQRQTKPKTNSSPNHWHPSDHIVNVVRKRSRNNVVYAGGDVLTNAIEM